MSREAAALWFRRRRLVTGVSPGTVLLPFSDMIYGRRDEASAIDGDGTVDWYSTSNAGPRLTSLGCLVEPLSKNWLNRSIHFDASWSVSGSAVLTPGSTSAGTAPDGTTPARVDYASGATSQISQTIGAGTIPDNTVVSLVIAITGVAGGEVLRLRLDNKAGTTGTSGAGTLLDITCHATPGVWTYYRLPAIDVGSGGTGVSVRLLNAAAGGVKSVHLWGGCAIEGKWDRSPIRTVSSAVTAQPDVCGYLDAQIPEHLRKNATEIPITPHWAPTGTQGLASGQLKVLLGFQPPQLEFGGIYEFRVRHTGTDVRAEIAYGGVVMATSPVLSGSSPRTRIVPAFDPAGGRAGINGVWGSAGTSCEMPVGQVRLGGRWLDTQSGYEIDGYIEEPVSV